MRKVLLPNLIVAEIEDGIIGLWTNEGTGQDYELVFVDGEYLGVVVREDYEMNSDIEYFFSPDFAETNIDEYDIKYPVKNWLQQVLDENNLNRYQVYKLSGLPQNTMSDILSKDIQLQDVRVNTLHLLALAIVKNDESKYYESVVEEIMDRFIIQKKS